jgi:hypothetical protein
MFKFDREVIDEVLFELRARSARAVKEKRKLSPDNPEDASFVAHLSHKLYLTVEDQGLAATVAVQALLLLLLGRATPDELRAAVEAAIKANAN